MNTQAQANEPTYQVDVARGCIRHTLRIPGSAGFPAAIVTARVIPERFTGSWRVVVAAGSQSHSVLVSDLCQNNIPTEEQASQWARECVRAAEQFWRDCTYAD